MRRKQLIAGMLLACLLGTGVILTKEAQHIANYEGLPTVSCQDYTKPVLQNFSFTLHILVNGKAYPLDAQIGHDYGKCLHTMYVNDTSGTVYVKANDTSTYTLGQFFDVWKKTFKPTQMMQYQVGEKDGIRIFVNGKEVNTFRDTPLLPHEQIEITYR